MRKWIREEMIFWTSINDQIKNKNPFQTDYFINPTISAANQIDNLLNQYQNGDANNARQAIETLNAILPRYATRQYLSCRTVAAKAAHAIATVDPAAAWLTIAFATEPAENITFGNQAKLIPILRALDVVRDKTFDARAAAESLATTHTDLQRKWSAQVQEKVTTMDDTNATAKARTLRWLRRTRRSAARYRAMRTRHEKDMEAMRVAFSLRCSDRLPAPVRKQCHCPC